MNYQDQLAHQLLDGHIDQICWVVLYLGSFVGTVKLEEGVASGGKLMNRLTWLTIFCQAAAGRPTTSRHVRRRSARSWRRSAAGVR